MDEPVKNSSKNILVVEDEDITRKNLVHILTKEGYEVVAVDSGVKALDLLASQSFDLVVTDFKMEKVDGMQVLARTRELHPFTEVIMITGYATVDLAVKAMKRGAYFYLAKPFKIAEVRNIVREALLKRRLQLENVELKTELERSRQIPSLIGKSAAMLSVIETIKQIAPSDSNVLILGESGTGKELVAKAVHTLSPRSGEKFVAFNCGAFTEELMASELFGHEKGAFTGADREKSGLIQTANGGTLFLDEIGDMPLTMQVKLLRAIQEKEILRVGGVTPMSVDVRFIAATHRDLQRDIEQGLFRKDLYYRLNVISLHLPPLAEREGDVPLLMYHFLKGKSQAAGKDIHEIDRKAMSLLCQYSWPGNVRELENVIERAVALVNGRIIHEDDLPDYIRTLSIETYRQATSSVPTLEEQEKHYIKWVLEKCEGNKTRAAQMMGIDRVSLWRKLKRFKIEEASG
jgi:DNA-binding NtrC family response regulator